jgi:very-short-patch-repair endonuclease
MLIRAKGALKALVKRELKKQYPTESVNLESAGEEALAGQIRIFGLPQPKREVQLIPGRLWRCDFYWNVYDVVVEVEGGVWKGGKHTSARGFEEDCRKYNAITAKGFKLFRFSTEMVTNGEAVRFLEKLFEEIP